MDRCTTGQNISAGTCYLRDPEGAQQSFLSLDGSVFTGIDKPTEEIVRPSSRKSVFNLAGQRVKPLRRGIYKAEVIANIVRPYVGFGYRLPISKDQRTLFCFNAGILCWGDPKLVTHDGTDLVHDVEGVKGQVGQYVKLVTVAKVYPILNVTFSRRLF